MNYQEFLDKKLHCTISGDFGEIEMPDAMMDFQRDLTELALNVGRFALLEDCGLGKTLQELVWAHNVARKTNKPVLILTFLAVAPQFIREGDKFGIKCSRSIDGSVTGDIVVTNYQKLHMFNWRDFGGVVCDESSILKSFDGSTKATVTEFLKKVPYRLLGTATASPNDYTELGTSSEALGYMGHMDMLGRFFKNNQNNIATRRMYGEAPKWEFKPHSEQHFWRWVTSWARAIRKPSDLGYSDDKFILPNLVVNEHLVRSDFKPDGFLFSLPATNLAEQREEGKMTINERCEKVAELVSHNESAVVWCHRNDEGDMLESMIPDAIQVSGRDSDDAKEAKLMAFSEQRERVIITKPKIGAWGLNWQHCGHHTYFPSHSFEQLYQAVRRSLRFGRTEDVRLDFVLTEGQRRILDNLQQKEKKAEVMYSNLVAEMNNSIELNSDKHFNVKQELPSWIM